MAARIDHVLERQVPLNEGRREEQDRDQDRLFRVVEDSAELPEDELLRADLGHEQKLERLGVPLIGQRRHRLGVDEQQAQEADRHEGESAPADDPQDKPFVDTRPGERPPQGGGEQAVGELDEDRSNTQPRMVK